jgi:hypothetical protein
VLTHQITYYGSAAALKQVFSYTAVAVQTTKVTAAATTEAGVHKGELELVAGPSRAAYDSLCGWSCQAALGERDASLSSQKPTHTLPTSLLSKQSELDLYPRRLKPGPCVRRGRGWSAHACSQPESTTCPVELRAQKPTQA